MAWAAVDLLARWVLAKMMAASTSQGVLIFRRCAVLSSSAATAFTCSSRGLCFSKSSIAWPICSSCFSSGVPRCCLHPAMISMMVPE